MHNYNDKWFGSKQCQVWLELSLSYHRWSDIRNWFINMPSGYYIETGGVEWGEEGGRQTDRQTDRHTESYYEMIILLNILLLNSLTQSNPLNSIS